MLSYNCVLDQCESTNTEVKKLGDAGFPHGTWLSTKIQKQGRGRLGREWVSKEGNLFLSILVRVRNHRLWTWIPLATAMGAYEFLKKEFPEIECQIKWPNDIYVNDAKMAGILCESCLRGNESYIVIGIGINCTSSPAGVDRPTTHLALHSKQENICADRIREGVIQAILKEVEGVERDNIEKLAERYQRAAYFKNGTFVRWGNDTSRNEGTVRGLGPHGELVVTNQNGIIESLVAEDVEKVSKIRRASYGFPV